MNEELALDGYPRHQKSIFIVDSPWHIIVFLVNILLPGFGTILAGLVKGGPIKYNNLHVGIFQFLTVFIFLFGWCWSIYSGYKIYRVSRDHQLFVEEYESELDSEEDEEASPGKP